MNAKFLYKDEFSTIGTLESIVCGIEVDGRAIAFTGDCKEIENFDIDVKEMALFANNAKRVHFEWEVIYIPVRGKGLNDKALMEEISVLTVRAIAGREVIKAAQISRVVSRW